MVGTDDIAWNHSIFGWSDALVDGVLRPYRAGAAVSYRPPGWVRHGRDGAVEVADAEALLLGRDHVIPEDVQALFAAVAAHRLVPDAEGVSATELAQAIAQAVAVD